MKRLLSLSVLSVFLLGVGFVQAKNLGNAGQVFAVQEQDFRTFVQQRLAHLQADGELQTYEQAAQQRIAHEVYHPKTLNLPTQSNTTVIQVNPSVRLNRAITDQTGKVLVPAGVVVNPFKTVKLRETLLFFNGADPEQVRWVKHHYEQYRWVKFILTGGDLRDMANQFGRIYYDQRGLLTQKLHITHVPAIAQQDGLNWKITTIGRKAF